MLLKLTIQYDGTDFKGWQVQPNGRTVQGALEQAFRQIEGRETSVQGAGRTDAGVHALGQVATVTVQKTFASDVWVRALNANLPDDVRVTRVEEAPDRFHARIYAINKVYRYRICTVPVVSPFIRRYVFHKAYDYDLDLMREAARLLIGKHDFVAFTITDRETKTTVRDLRRLDIERGGENGEELVIWAEANGFLRVMVRSLAGTLIGVGDGTLTPNRVQEALETGRRDLAGPTAPAAGLTLVRVDY